MLYGLVRRRECWKGFRETDARRGPSCRWRYDAQLICKIEVWLCAFASQAGGGGSSIFAATQVKSVSPSVSRTKVSRTKDRHPYSVTDAIHARISSHSRFSHCTPLFTLWPIETQSHTFSIKRQRTSRYAFSRFGMLGDTAWDPFDATAGWGTCRCTVASTVSHFTCRASI